MKSINYALVLGGSQGLGLATVTKLLEEKIPVICVHRDMRKDLVEIEGVFKKFTKGTTPFVSINKDAIGNKGRSEILDRLNGVLGPYGKISLLVHSIAKGNLKPMFSASGDTCLEGRDLLLTSEAMAFSLFDWVKSLCLQKMLASDSRVVAFTSEGSRRIIPGYGAVGTAKAALEAIVRQIAVEYAGVGVRANCIQAGVTRTKSMEQLPNSRVILEHSRARNPNGRLTTPRDVANAVYLLSLPEAAWITGNILKVDGGESLC